MYMFVNNGIYIYIYNIVFVVYVYIYIYVCVCVRVIFLYACVYRLYIYNMCVYVVANVCNVFVLL